MADRDESDRDTAAARERVHAAGERPVAAQLELQAMAGAESAAVVNVERDPDGAERSAGQSADRLAAAERSKASEQWELPASKSDGAALAARESESLVQHWPG